MKFHDTFYYTGFSLTDLGGSACALFYRRTGLSGTHGDEISEKVLAGFGENGFGMELDPFQEQFPVPYPHDFVPLSPCRYLEVR